MSCINKIENFFQREHEGFFNFVALSYICGILIFFSLVNEPDQKIILTMFSCVTLVKILLYKKCKDFISFRIIIICIFAFATGFTLSFVRTNNIDYISLRNPIENIKVMGRVDSIKRMTYGNQLIVSQPVISTNTLSQNSLKKIRLYSNYSNTKNIIAGDFVSFKCSLKSPPAQIVPGGYDFTFKSYFENIGAVGKITSKVKIISKEKSGYFDFINILRRKILDKLISNLGFNEGNFAAGIFIGETSVIKRKTLENMRFSGISHILCVSGLHLTVVAMMFYTSFRVLFNLSNEISYRLDIKKISAFLAILCSLIYLLITGMQTAASRAFIMTSLVLISIIFSRETDPLKSLSFAAVIILSIWPEQITYPSFQLSFIAVCALLSAFDLIMEQLDFSKKTNSLFQKIKIYIITNIYSSLIATLATSPIIIYHFYVYSNYTIIANLFAVPILTFITIPVGIIALILSFCQLSYLPFYILKLSIKSIIFISSAIVTMPFSVIYTSYLGKFSISLYLAGFIIFCFIKGKERLIGLILIIGAMGANITIAKPDIFINREEKIVAVKSDEGLIFFGKTSKFVERFVSNWLGYEKPKIIEKTNPEFNISNKNYKIDFEKNLLIINNQDSISLEQKTTIFSKNNKIRHHNKTRFNPKKFVDF
jgi:competence protein ComEC